jgi:hypothetical protein
MCREGSPVDHSCMVMFNTAGEATRAIQRHLCDNVLTDGRGLQGRRRKRL